MPPLKKAYLLIKIISITSFIFPYWKKKKSTYPSTNFKPNIDSNYFNERIIKLSVHIYNSQKNAYSFCEKFRNLLTLIL